MLYGIHLRAISEWVPNLLFYAMSLKSKLEILLPHLPKANVLMGVVCWSWYYSGFIYLGSLLLTWINFIPHMDK